MAAGEALESYHHHSRISVDQQQRKLTAPVDNHEDNIDVVKLENDDFTGEFTTPLRFPRSTRDIVVGEAGRAVKSLFSVEHSTSSQ